MSAGKQNISFDADLKIKLKKPDCLLPVALPVLPAPFQIQRMLRFMFAHENIQS
jgi:hypothetical protein